MIYFVFLFKKITLKLSIFVGFSVWRKEGSLCDIEKQIIWIRITINFYPSSDRGVTSDSDQVLKCVIGPDFTITSSPQTTSGKFYIHKRVGLIQTEQYWRPRGEMYKYYLWFKSGTVEQKPQLQDISHHQKLLILFMSCVRLLDAVSRE